MNFFNELSKRWSADSPTFFKKLIKLGAWLVATGIGLIAVPAGIESIITKEVSFDFSLLIKIASYMILSGSIISVVAKLPADDPKQLNK